MNCEILFDSKSPSVFLDACVSYADHKLSVSFVCCVDLRFHTLSILVSHLNQVQGHCQYKHIVPCPLCSKREGLAVDMCLCYYLYPTFSIVPPMSGTSDLTASIPAEECLCTVYHCITPRSCRYTGIFDRRADEKQIECIPRAFVAAYRKKRLYVHVYVSRHVSNVWSPTDIARGV